MDKVKHNDTKYAYTWGFPFPSDDRGKEPACQCRRHKGQEFNIWVGKIPWRRSWQSALVFFPTEFPWTKEPGGATVHRVAKSQT